MQRRPNAFTLIELAIVLLVIGISAAIVFPKLTGNVVQRAQLRSSVNRIAALAEYAHQQAACTRRTHVLYLDPEEGVYWVARHTSDKHIVPGVDNSILKGRLPDEVELAGVKHRGKNTDLKDIVAIQFSPQGWADPATIDLICSTGETMCVLIDEFSAQVRTYDAKGIH
jgi:prepilin-type N-terminal cleavage/methylation domain-containing protein